MVQDRSSGDVFETPQFMYMFIAMTLFQNYDKEVRLDYVKRYYDAISTFKINIPTPIMAGVRTPLRQFASCVLVDSDDSLPSIFSSDHAIGKYVAQRAGIGINAGRIRGIGSKIRGGEVQHTGVIPFLKKFESTVGVVHKTESEVEVQPFISQSGTKKSKTFLSSKTTKEPKTTEFVSWTTQSNYPKSFTKGFWKTEK